LNFSNSKSSSSNTRVTINFEFTDFFSSAVIAGINVVSIKIQVITSVKDIFFLL
jgi:hypothetical protein